MSHARTPEDRRRLRELGTVLRTLRELLRLSRPELAQKAGVAAGTVKGAELAKHAPTRDTLVRLLGALQQPEEQRWRLLNMLPSTTPRCPRCDLVLVCPQRCGPTTGGAGDTVP